MKKSLFKIFSTIAGVAAVFAVAMTAGSQIASAGWNDAPTGECQTVSVLTSSSTVTNCWSTANVSAAIGETVNVKVYFHNNTNAVASDVRIKTSDNRNAVNTTQVSGSVIVGGSVVASGSGSISLPANAKLTYVKTVVQYQKTGYTTEDRGATTEIFTSGVQVGPIRGVNTDPQWGDQGVVKVVYKVESNGTVNQGQCYDSNDNDGDGLIDMNDPGCISSNGTTETNTVTQALAPTATTQMYSNLNDYDGRVRFNGSFNSNGSSTTTCFEYRMIGGNIIRRGGTNQGSTQIGTFSDDVMNLAQGSYEYRACAFNINGTGYGTWVPFTIGNGNNNQISNISVSTLQYSNLDSANGSVTLRGQYYNLTSGTAYTYFQYRLNSGSTISTSQLGYTNTANDFSQSLSNLSTGEYSYQACASNNGNIRCGDWVYFSINRYGNPVYNNQQPTVQTLAPFQISDNFVTMDGFYNMNGCSGYTYFEYGPTMSLGNRTNSISRSQSGSMAQSINGLNSSTTYYYRAVVQNCNSTVYGDVRSFTTSARSTVVYDNNPIINTGTTTVIRNNTVRTNTVTTAIGTGARFIRLTIDNHRDTVAKGDELAYDVEWENISNQNLRDLVLEISIPESLEIVSIERGQIDHKTNTVYINIDELRAGERDDTTIRAKVTGTLQSNESVTARAIIAFENPENKAQENAIAYDSDSYIASQNVLGASIFGLGFLPGTLAGWLFIILLIILLILLIRYATGRIEKRNHYYHYPDDSGNVPPVPPVTGTSTTTTTVDYTPYRPTPKN